MPNIGIIVTDGASTYEKGHTLLEAAMAKDSGIDMFAIGIGPTLNTEELEGIVNDPKDLFLYYAENFDNLVEDLEKIIEVACISRGIYFSFH